MGEEGRAARAAERGGERPDGLLEERAGRREGSEPGLGVECGQERHDGLEPLGAAGEAERRVAGPGCHQHGRQTATGGAGRRVALPATHRDQGHAGKAQNGSGAVGATAELVADRAHVEQLAGDQPGGPVPGQGGIGGRRPVAEQRGIERLAPGGRHPAREGDRRCGHGQPPRRWVMGGAGAGAE